MMNYSVSYEDSSGNNPGGYSQLLIENDCIEDAFDIVAQEVATAWIEDNPSDYESDECYSVNVKAE